MEIESAGIEPSEATVTIEYEGAPVMARPGTSVAAALTAAGIAEYRHALVGDRGLFCGMGVCGECAITVDGQPSRLACMTPVHDGMNLCRQPLNPEMSTDSGAPRVGAEQLLEPELLVVGGGPAGLAAAAVAAEAGVDVHLVDERSGLGGQYYKQPAASFTIDPARLDAQYRAGRALIERVAAAGVQVWSGVRIWGANGPSEFYAARGDERWTIRPQRVVLATGAYERVAPFPGWTLPGVMTTGAGQSLLRAYQVAPGKRVLVAGNGPLNIQLAAELVRAGGNVVGLVELAAVTHPRNSADVARMAFAAPSLIRDGAGYMATLRRARVPVLTRRAVIRVEGNDRAEQAAVARIDAAGKPVPGTERRFDVDAVCVGLGFMPGNEIARLLGARHSVDPRTGGYVIDRSPTGRTSVDRVWVVGDGAEVRGAKVAEAAGTQVGGDVAASLGRPDADPARLRRASRARKRHERFQQALWRSFAAPALFSQLADEETLICRCESVPLKAIDNAIGDLTSAGALKRVTRTGMGRCQGRFCGFVVADRVAASTGVPVDSFGGFAPQPPFRPTPVAALAAQEVAEPEVS